MATNPTPASSLSRVRERARVRARGLRQTPTDAEALLWYHLRNRNFQGLKFRRQHPVGPYFADFACVEIGLAIELDGGQHVDQVAYDHRREQQFAQAGLQTTRFWNHEVLNETEAVLEKLRQIVQTLTPALSRTRERE